MAPFAIAQNWQEAVGMYLLSSIGPSMSSPMTFQDMVADLLRIDIPVVGANVVLLRSRAAGTQTLKTRSSEVDLSRGFDNSLPGLKIRGWHRLL
jgi:hypothetical protein